MICKKCNNEILGDAKFCIKCGASIDKEAKPKRKKTKLLLFSLSLVLILGILTGAWGGYYTAINGWEVIPFAGKLTFLSIVKLDKEKIETYSEPTYEEDYEDMNHKDSPIDEVMENMDDEFNDHLSENLESMIIDQGQISTGYWVGTYSKGNVMIGFSHNGMASGVLEKVLDNSSDFQVKAFHKEFILNDNLLRIGDEDCGEFNLDKNELKILLEDGSVNLRKIENTITFDGLWLLANNNEDFIEFENNQLGKTTVFTDDSSDNMGFQYYYDEDMGTLTLTPTSTENMDIKILDAKIVGEYLLISSEEGYEEVILFKKLIGGN